MKKIYYKLSSIEEYENDLKWRRTLNLYALTEVEESNNVSVWLDNLSDENLPNAKYISMIIKSYEANPQPWKFVLHDMGVVNYKMWKEAWDTGVTRTMNLDRYYIQMMLFDETNQTLFDPLLALVAWDDCAYMLFSAPNDLELLAKLGDPRAILLYSACKVLSLDKES